MEWILIISFLTGLPILVLHIFSKRKKPAKKKKRGEEKPPEGKQWLKHHCGNKTLVCEKFLVGQSYTCSFCKKEVKPVEARCPRCQSLVKMKVGTPLFFYKRVCPVCKFKIEFPDPEISQRIL
jgi:DNA-directed RNA polymerase subunit RPC12/RpoP